MPVHYNPKPLRDMIRRAASRRIDIIGIWNSEGLQSSTGWDTAIQQALGVDRYGVYATGCHSFCEGDGGSGSGVGFGDNTVPSETIETLANGTLFTYGNARVTTAPASQLQFLDWSASPAGSFAPTKPLYIEAAASNNTPTGLTIGNAASTRPIPTTEALTWTFWGANWGASGGSFQPIVRLSASPFTVLNTLGTINYTGTNGTILKTEVNVAADASRATGVQFRTHTGVNPTTMLGPLFLTYMRACRTNKTNGIAVTPFYSAGGRSAYDMYEALIAVPETTWEHLFDAATTYQGATLADHCIVFDIYEGSNQANETGVNIGAPQPGDADHPDNFVWYITSLIAQIQFYWVSTGRSASNIVFRVSVSHPINDSPIEAECAAYRAALVAQLDFDGTHSNVTVLDRAAAASLSEMVAVGDFSDTVHLNDAGYTRTERKAWNSLLNTASRSDRTGRTVRARR